MRGRGIIHTLSNPDFVDCSGQWIVQLTSVHYLRRVTHSVPVNCSHLDQEVYNTLKLYRVVPVSVHDRGIVIFLNVDFISQYQSVFITCL